MRIRTYIPFLVVLLLVFSCSKELSYEKNGVNPGKASFKAVIDGTPWAAKDSAQGASILGGLISLVGISAGNQQLNITLNDTVTGIYRLNQGSFSLASLSDADSSGVFSFTTNEGIDSTQSGGLVTVTEIDRVSQTISGTFSFKVYRNFDGQQKTITQGIFQQIPFISALPPASSTDTMRATIDGSNWTAQTISASALSGVLTISGSHSDGTFATILAMPQNVTPGLWTLDITAGVYVGLYDPGPGIVMASSAGALQILENDQVTKRIRGNFLFQASVPLGAATTRIDQIINGYFSVVYH